MSKSAAEEEIKLAEGLVFRGRIIGRSKKFFEKCEKFRYTYIVIAQNVKYFIYTWGEHILLPLNEFVEIPVNIQTYVDRNGKINIQYIMYSEHDSDEELF